LNQSFQNLKPEDIRRLQRHVNQVGYFYDGEL
jgi:hypothetical protein